MEPNRKRPSVKKDGNRSDVSQPKFPPSQSFARPPTTGTSSSSSSEDRSMLVKSSDDTSPEDQIEMVPAANERGIEISFPSHTPKFGEISSAVRSGLELKFNSGPSAYFSSNKSDLPVDINLSPQDGNRIPSPSSISSLTSRPLEWDSGADVGYMEPGIETGLSTIERIALAQGSAILLPRSDPEGTTETGSKPVTKLVIPAVERLIGTPAAESTLIKDKFLSPVVGLKSFLPEGISPIISSNAYLAANSKETRKEHHNNEARTSLELQFKHLSLAENNAGRNQEGLSHDTANRESNELSQDSQTPVNVETENLEDDGSDTHNIESNDIPVIKFGHKEESKSSEDLLKALPEEESVFPLSLKKSASCSNLQQVSQSVNQHFLKPLKRHFQNSASSSSISTVIDRSKKKSRKLFLTSSSISERTETRSKASKFPRKILSPSKKFHFSNNSNKASQSCLPPKSHRKLAENPLDLISTSKNSQVAFHTSIQQSILDELQQCVNEISNNFNSSSRSKHSGDKIVGAQEEGKKGSGSTRENCSTLESIASVQTNDSWAMDLNAKDSLTSAEKAKSFEYLPGDIYERNSSEHFQLQKKSESSCSTSEKIDFSVSSKEESWNPSSLHLFERELERGVNLLKDFINNSTSFDSRKKLLLVKKIAKKLIELENESYLKSASKGGPSGYRKPSAKASDTYLRDQFSKQQRAKGSSSELSDSTRISQSYIDTTSGSSCLNLVMKPLKKSTSVESISEQPQKISSGIRHIQENYRSNNCTFNSDGEDVNDETYVDERIVRQNPEKTNKASENQGGAKMSDNYGFESSSMGWSKSSCSTDNQQSAFYGMEFRQSTNKLPSKKHQMLSPHHQRHAKYRDIGRNKVNGSRLIENSNDLIDGRTINLGGSRFKPFLISDNDSSSKGYFDHNAFPWPDWRKPTSDSERRYEEKLVVQKGDKKESTLLYKYLDAERRNHLLWIQSEINHLSNLKALIEKQAKFKENFKLLKSKRVDCKGDFREKHSKNTQKSSSDSTKVSDDANSNGPISFQPKSANASTNSSDKENRDITNKNVTGGMVVESLVRSKFGVSTSKNQSQNQTFKSQLSSNESRYISAGSDATNNTWAEDSIKVPDKSLKKSKTVSSKPKKNSSLHKKVMKPVSYTILFDPPKIAPNFLTRNASPKIIKDVESSANSKVSELSLQECLAKKHPEIIRRAEFRRNCIAELSCLRQLQNERKKQIVTAVISSEEVPKPSVSLPSLKEKRIFTQKKLRQQTEKKYRQSFEVKQKLKEQKTKEDYRTNRLMAEVFARKLQRKTLRGQVDLSNSVMVLES